MDIDINFLEQKGYIRDGPILVLVSAVSAYLHYFRAAKYPGISSICGIGKDQYWRIGKNVVSAHPYACPLYIYIHNME